MTLLTMIPLRALARSVSILAAVLAVALLTAPTAAAEPHPNGEALACGQEIARTDENGTFHLRFQCLPTQGLLNWGFTFNPQWRAMAISPVDEAGLRTWRNSAFLTQNSNHPGESINYLFHGTVPGVFVGDDIDYQDFLTFRANFGGTTGTARVAFAGSVILKP